MAHRLEGRWRSSNIVLSDHLPIPLPTDDGFIYLNQIDAVTGEITDAFHRIGNDVIPIQGQVIDTGSGYSISMKHAEGNRIRRYQGILVFESPLNGQLVIFARTYTVRRPEDALDAEAPSGAAVMAADDPPQDDGTVIITRP